MIVSVSGASGVLFRVHVAFSLGTPKDTQLNAIMMVGAVGRLLYCLLCTNMCMTSSGFNGGPLAFMVY